MLSKRSSCGYQPPRKVTKRTLTKKPSRKSEKIPIDLSTSPAEFKAASVANSTECALLLLPAEIRLRIFELVIGDSRCIEIGYACPGEELPAGIPLRSPGELIIPGPGLKGFYLAHKDDYEVFPRPHEVSSQWVNAFKVDSRFHPLNRICRQIYFDSMILPYRLHTFALGNLSTLRAWINSLAPEQKDDVRSIFYADFATGDVPTIANIILNELPRLNRLFLPRSFRTSQSTHIREWLKALRSRNLRILFLDRPDQICKYVKVSK